MKKFLPLLLAVLLALAYLVFFSPSKPEDPVINTDPPIVLPNNNTDVDVIDEDGWYYTMEDVAEYLETYEHLPDNFLTKDEAEELGWVSKEGNLWEVADGMVIGGDRFGNYEGLLPKEKGRVYYECDIDYDGGYRNGERIIFSNDGLIYYTDDHYESFELIFDPQE